jgi:hypothetical protein
MMPEPQYDQLYIQLNDRLNKLEDRSGLMSKSMFTRMLTTWGYVIGLQLLFGFGVLILGGIFTILFGN